MDSLPVIIQAFLSRERKIFQLRSLKCALKLGLSTLDDDKIK